MYYLALISNETEQVQLCRGANPQDYLLTTISWDDLLEQADQLRKADVVIADLLGANQDITHRFSQLQQEIKLYKMEVSLLLLVTPAALGQVSHLKGYDDFLLLEPGESKAGRKQRELTARLELLLRRQGKGAHQRVIRVKELTVDLDKYEVRKAGQPLALTYKEYELLKYLLTHRDRVFTREALLNAVWGYGYYGGTRTVDVHIRRIRAKLGDEAENYIKTIWGVGYRFVEGTTND